MISFREAQQIIVSKARSIGTELIDLETADGRVLAEDIPADRDYPPFNRSAMDGYAFQLHDWEEGIREFVVQQIIYAGERPGSTLKKGHCFKIMTGAAVPNPADVVIRREDAKEAEDKVSFTIEKLSRFQNIAKQGEDLKQNEIAIKANSLCTPALIGTLATLGKSKILVYKLPKTSLFTTGNEFKPADSEVSSVEIRNSNQWFLKSALKKWNITPFNIAHIPDKIEALKSVIGSALNSDIVIMSGGVSAGDADFVPQVMEELGVKKLFHKVAIKPGKPIWCGELPNGGLVFALPGNPFSCLVNFKLFIEPYLSVTMGLPVPQMLSLPFEGTRIKKSNLDEFFPVQFSGNPTCLRSVPINGSGDIRLGLHANAIGYQPADKAKLDPGIQVSYYPLF